MASTEGTRVNTRGRVTGQATLVVAREVDGQVYVKLGLIQVLIGRRQWDELLRAGNALPEAESAPPAPRPDDDDPSPFLEVLGRDTEATCVAHRRRVAWRSAPDWWHHLDNTTCMALWHAPSPLVFIRKDGTVSRAPGETKRLLQLNAMAAYMAAREART